jgi:hypothetical protein
MTMHAQLLEAGSVRELAGPMLVLVLVLTLLGVIAHVAFA